MFCWALSGTVMVRDVEIGPGDNFRDPDGRSGPKGLLFWTNWVLSWCFGQEICCIHAAPNPPYSPGRSL